MKMRNIRKIFFLSFITASVILFVSTGRLLADDDDAGSGGDASPSKKISVVTGKYTGDLGPSDATDFYTIAVKTGETIAFTFCSTNTVDFVLVMWPSGGSTVAKSYSYTTLGENDDFLGYEKSCCISYNALYFGGTYTIIIRFPNLSDFVDEPLHYEFYVSTSVQSEGSLGMGDVGCGRVNNSSDRDYSSITDGNYTGYLDYGDSVDFYKLSDVPKDYIITADITTSNNLRVNVKLLLGTSSSKKEINISNGATGRIEHVVTSSYDYYLKIAVTNGGTGTYSLSLASEYDYLCVVPYPNPFDISKNHNKIIFDGSGVPNGKIRIYTFDGKLIKTLEETDGDSELHWYPVRDNIPSGIYFFGTENPSEKNMGKITIIR